MVRGTLDPEVDAFLRVLLYFLLFPEQELSLQVSDVCLENIEEIPVTPVVVLLRRTVQVFSSMPCECKNRGTPTHSLSYPRTGHLSRPGGPGIHQRKCHHVENKLEEALIMSF